MATCAAKSSAQSGRADSAFSLRAWLDRATPGASVEYHRGLLARDRSPDSELREDVRRRVAEVADAACRAAEDGRVHLVQRRNGEFDFSYLAIKSTTGGATEVIHHAA